MCGASERRLRALALVLALAGSAAGGCLTASVDSPWQRARLSLEQALNYLQSRSPVTAGRRERAIALVREAIAEIEAGLAAEES
jgi:hypothetical protein